MTVAPDAPAVAALSDFAALVGTEGPVGVAGGRTQWEVGGLPVAGTRFVAAPTGVVLHEPAEMIVRVRAGTTVSALAAALAEGGQMVPLDPADPSRATVGGVLAVGHSGIRRLRYGPVRDTVLEVRFVSAAGELVKAGGPVVKNVTGFDLCRLLVGSLGTLGLLGEVVLRCHPLPAVSRWFQSVDPGVVDPFTVLAQLYRPSSVLWDGSHVWVLLEGHPEDVASQGAVLGPAFEWVAGPPALVPPGGSLVAGGAGGGSSGAPGAGGAGGRLSLAPGDLRRLPRSGPRWLAQVGVGVVATAGAAEAASLAASLGLSWPPVLAPPVAEIHGELKRRFDPTGRLNPGRMVSDA